MYLITKLLSLRPLIYSSLHFILPSLGTECTGRRFFIKDEIAT